MASDIIKAASIPFAMGVIGGLAFYAMKMGIDGALFMSSIAIIGGLAGYRVKTAVDKAKSKKTQGSQSIVD